ncbi:MAG TPA: pyridoxal kinase [Hyphomicrobiaceae bacterium]|jgi:pyridoxine kinase|nr:pyridoxal kinase [Hyphomicrobiaceae bacterium]
MATVLAISSHVVRGHVGLDASVPALQALGHEVWAVPTVMFASRPGLGRLQRFELPAPEIGALLSALDADQCWRRLDGVLTGYFPSAAAVAAAAEAVARIKAANPSVQVLVDPILGDAGSLYVAPDTAAAIRDRLLPLADVATPNLFELGWLSGRALGDRAAIVEAARRLGPPAAVVTSALESGGEIATLLVGAGAVVERRAGKRSGIPNGAGDLFAGLLLGHLLGGQTLEGALGASLAGLEAVLAASVDAPVLNLAALLRKSP